MKRAVKVFRIGLSVLVLLLGIGSVYQWMAVRQDRDAYRPVGQLYEVNGKNMHLYTEGSGKGTVVFASGWGTVNPYTDFYPLTERVASFAKVAVYDRPGTGYSELTDRNRDVDEMVAEIHALLHASGAKPPYVLAGHSLGSLETIRYAQTYPEEVKGILLIDGGTPEYYAEAPVVTALSHLQRFAIDTGIARTLLLSSKMTAALHSERNGLKAIPAELREMESRALLIRGFNRNMTDELRRSADNARKVAKGKKPLNIPLIALTAGAFGRQDKGWLESQKGWTDWSSDTEHIVIHDARHYIHHYEPELVAEQIRRLIEK